MNDSDFDNLFNEKMNEVPNFPQKKEGWQKVATTLNSKPFYSPQSSKTKWWWLPFLLLLLGWNIWQTWALHKASENSFALVETIQNLEKRFAEKHDTFYTSGIRFHTDTIYKTVYIIEKNERFTGNLLNESSLLREYSTKKPLSKTDIEPKNTSNNIITKKDVDSLNPSKTISTIKKNATNNTNSAALDTLKMQPSPSLPKNDITPETKESLIKKAEIAAIETDSIHQTSPPQYADIKKDSFIQNKSFSDSIAIAKKDSVKVALENFEKKLTETYEKEPIIEKMPKIHIKEIQLGIQSGFSDLLPHQKDIGLSQWLGLSSSIAISKRFRLTSAVDKISLSFKVNQRPLNIEPLNLPIEPTPSNDYVLRYIEGENKSWQMGLGANYILTPTKPVRTYLSAGYMRRSILSSEAEFEYLNSITGEEISFKGENTAKHIDNWWHIGLGGEITVYHKIGAKLEASYIHDFNRSQNKLQYWLLSGGVFFNLR